MHCLTRQHPPAPARSGHSSAPYFTISHPTPPHLIQPACVGAACVGVVALSRTRSRTGVFEAASEPGMNLDPTAWCNKTHCPAGSKARACTFPAQIRVRRVLSPPPARIPRKSMPTGKMSRANLLRAEELFAAPRGTALQSGSTAQPPGGPQHRAPRSKVGSKTVSKPPAPARPGQARPVLVAPGKITKRKADQVAGAAQLREPGKPGPPLAPAKTPRAKPGGSTDADAGKAAPTAVGKISKSRPGQTTSSHTAAGQAAALERIRKIHRAAAARAVPEIEPPAATPPTATPAAVLPASRRITRRARVPKLPVTQRACDPDATAAGVSAGGAGAGAATLGTVAKRAGSRVDLRPSVTPTSGPASGPASKHRALRGSAAAPNQTTPGQEGEKPMGTKRTTSEDGTAAKRGGEETTQAKSAPKTAGRECVSCGVAHSTTYVIVAKTSVIFRVGIVLDFVRLITRPPQGGASYVWGVKQHRLSRHQPFLIAAVCGADALLAAQLFY